MEPTRTGKAAPDDTPETYRQVGTTRSTTSNWRSPLSSRSVASKPASRRSRASPASPLVLYRYKPEDYIHKFKPDPKKFRKYPGYENMTMAERREFFGYTYTGPNGPPEALTPASRDEMLKQIESEKLLDAEHGPRLSPLPLREGVGGRGGRGALPPTVTPSPPPQRPLPAQGVATTKTC